MPRAVVSLKEAAVKWPVVISDIALVRTQTEIAEQVGCSQPHISDLATGEAADTKFTVGVKLLLMRESLSEEIMRARRTQSRAHGTTRVG